MRVIESVESFVGHRDGFRWPCAFNGFGFCPTALCELLRLRGGFIGEGLGTVFTGSATRGNLQQ